MPRDVDAAIDLLRTQWDRLRDWIPAIVDDHEPSVLEGWTVPDLVAHLWGGPACSRPGSSRRRRRGPSRSAWARTWASTRAGREADRRGEPTRLAAEIADDPLAAIDSIAAEAFARLDELKRARRS